MFDYYTSAVLQVVVTLITLDFFVVYIFRQQLISQNCVAFPTNRAVAQQNAALLICTLM